MSNLPTDPFFKDQWHLLNSGQGNGLPGIDLNLADENPNNFDVWDDYSGKGVNILIGDSGVEKGHDDIAANFISEPANLPNYNYEQQGQPETDSPETSRFHGTAVAGIIAAPKNNGKGGVGVAYDAKIASVYNDKSLGPNFDISTNSWGYDGWGQLKPGGETETTLKNAVTQNRNGLGTVILFAAGNTRELLDNSWEKIKVDGRVIGSNANYENLAPSRYVFAVAALNNKGQFTTYSTPGANVLVSAFGGDDLNIIATDLSGDAGQNPNDRRSNLENLDYTKYMDGTSAATPMVAGVVALMLEANRNLGYRDVQEILAYSARQTDSDNSGNDKIGKGNGWRFNKAKTWNGGGLHYSEDYGYGLADTHAAVRLAETWQAKSVAADSTAAGGAKEINESKVSGNPNQIIPDGGTLTSTINTSGLKIGRAEAKITLEHQNFTDLVVKLVSPDGTESILMERPPKVGSYNGNNIGWENNTIHDEENSDTSNPVKQPQDASGLYTLENKVFSSTHFYGETGAGDWKLVVEDKVTGNTGTLKNWELTLYGDPLTDDSVYIYTDEFGNTFTDDAIRRNLSDTAGTDTINAAAIRSNITLNLTPETTSTLAGKPLTIAAGTVIENAYTGDGDDSLTGSDANNLLWGGRGKDTIDGGAGDDTLDNSLGGADSLLGGDGNDTYILTKAKGAGGTRIKDSGGNNTILISDVTLSGALASGAVGVAKNGSDLIVDLNADGEANSRDDLTIEDFFATGTGSFDNIGNLKGADFLATPPAPPANSSNAVTVPEPGGTPLPPPTATTPGTPAGQSANFVEGTDQDDYIEGSTASDTIIGKAGDDELYGNQGDDSLTGDDGDDYLEGDDGNDTLSGGLGSDLLDGLAGNDLISAGEDDDFVFGGEGDDILQGEAGDDLLFGEEGKDSLAGGDGNDDLYGEDGNDTLTGNAGSDTLDGGTGNDSLDGDEGADELYGGDGNDTITASSAGAGDSLYGGLGDDSYSIGSGGHLIADDDGNDTLSVASGTLSIGFAAGTIGVRRQENNGTNLEIDFNADGNFTAADDLTVVDFFADYNLDPGDGFIETVGNLTGQQILDSFPLVATPDDDELEGGLRGDNMDGLAGDDYINGNEGDDTIAGNTGNDFLDGDALFFVTEEDGEFFDGTGIGNDSLAGGEGSDTLYGGAGNDTLDGGAGIDVADYSLALDAVSVNLATGTALDGLGGTDTLLNIEVVLGSEFDDTLTGSEGDETLIGGGGADSMAGGTGNDSYIVDAAVPAEEEEEEEEDGITGAGSAIQDEGGSDTLTLNGAALTLAKAASGTLGLAKDGTTLILDLDGDGVADPAADLSILNFFGASGSAKGAGFIETVGNLQGNDILDLLGTITGTDGNDSLSGTPANDSINGLGGDDTLTGDAGSDTLDGGAGTDVADYRLATKGASVNLATGTAADGLEGTDTLLNIEVVLGSAFNDTLTGSQGDNTLIGGGGADSMAGGTGNDSYTVTAAVPAGQNGTTGAGSTIQDEGGSDTLTLNGAALTLALAANGTIGLANNGTTLILDLNGDGVADPATDLSVLNFFDASGSGAGAGFIETVGSLQGNQILSLLAPPTPVPPPTFTPDPTPDSAATGTDGNDSLTGTSATDSLDGRGGDDSISGGDGDDTLNGDAGDDTLSGEQGNNLLNGGEGNDFLNGGEGNDTLSDTAGNNSLSGAGLFHSRLESQK